MPRPSTIEICKVDLFTQQADLAKKYEASTVERILRIRDMYLWRLGNPSFTDRQFVEEVMGRHKISQAAAYSDLAIVHALLPMLTSAKRAFHRWRANEMAMEAYKMAKLRKDTKTMAAIVKTYAEINKVSLEDELSLPYEEIVPQMFTATDDPRVLGIKPIPNVRDKIKQMIAKYRAETIDIEDVEAEEYDLEERELFGEPEENPDE